MEKAELLYKIIEVIVLLIPIGTLVYKLGKTNEKTSELERRIINCENNMETMDNETQKSLSVVTNMLNDIKISIARLEERIKHLTDKSNNTKDKEVKGE